MSVQAKQHHPTTDELSLFGVGSLSDADMDRIASHVELCDACAMQVAGVQFDPETLFFGETNVDWPEAGVGSEPVRTQQLTALSSDLELEDVIGSGGMGVVYRAWQRGLNRYVAVKQLMLALPKDDEYTANAVSRFQREVRALGRVRHPHLVEVYSSGLNDEGRLFYSMQLIEGSDLLGVHRVLAQPETESSWCEAVTTACSSEAASVPGDMDSSVGAAHAITGDSYVHDVVMIVRQVASAVQCLHEHGIVHRDIKPGNIMVSAQGHHATLMDLGLAGLVEDPETRLTRSGQIAGSLPYISPEQFLGKEPSTASDIYNLGAVLWELITRRRLFDAGQHASEAALINRILNDEPDDIVKLVPGVSRDVAAIVGRCLEKRPEHRYESAKALADDLDRFLAGQPVLARQQSIVSRVARLARRHRKVLAALGFIVICSGMLIGGSMLANQLSPAIVNAPEPLIHNFIDDDSLVAFWPGEGGDDVATDESPNGHHGRLVGNVERKPGAIGNAFYFDGSSHITFGRSKDWNFLHDGSPFSISGFVKAEPGHASGGGGILSTADAQSGASYDRQGLILRINEPGIRLHIQGEVYPFPLEVHFAEELDPNVFTPFAVTFDGELCRIYVDGKLKETSPVSDSFTQKTSKEALAMGSIGTNSSDDSQPTDLFIGAIDELQVYNRALNEAEIVFLAQTNRTLSPTWKPAGASELVQITNATVVGAKTRGGTSIEATYDGSGMLEPFPTYPAKHSQDDSDAFLTEESETVSLHYDLGSVKSVNQVRLWNYHGGAHSEEGNRCGAQRIELFGSDDPAAFNDADHDSWTYITSKVFTRATGTGATIPYGDKHNFDDVSFRFLRLQIRSNCGGPRTGIAEVQFVFVEAAGE